MNRASSIRIHTAIDIGTNTLLAITGFVDADGALRVLADRHDITRLGEGVDRTRALAPAAMDRAIATLSRFVAEARTLGSTGFSAVATSAVRDASNRDVFLARVRDVVGSDDVQVIPGDVEAVLTFRGAGFDLGGAIAPQTSVLAFDIGGGSTEFAFGALDGAPRWHRSLDIGSVRLTERFLRADPPTRHELDALASHALDALSALPEPASPFALVGLAATVSTLAAIDHGGTRPPRPMRLEREAVERTYSRLASIPLAVRRNVAGLDPRRADVIVAGAAIAHAVMSWSRAESMHISSGGVRVGLLRDRLGC